MAGLRHGMSKTKLYYLWASIKRRCRKDKPMTNCSYSEKGIGMDPRWEVFRNFLEDVKEIPDGMTFDRIDSSRGYEPGNVRWATTKEQSRNKSNNHSLTISGVTKLLCEWEEETGLYASTILKRIKNGWPESELLLPANVKRHVLLTVGDRTKPLIAWAKETGVSPAVISQRLKRGWPPERVISTKRLIRPAGSWVKEKEPRNSLKNDHIRTYRTWSSMITRCRIPMSDSHAARGIKVCDRWKTFENFFEDIGDIPKGSWLDRIDNDGDYEPSNCRLATPKEQARNRRNNRHITIRGVTRTLAEWCEISGVKRHVLSKRIASGCPKSQWLASTGRACSMFLTRNGETKSVPEWAKELGISKDTIYARIRAGCPPERCLDPKKEQLPVVEMARAAGISQPAMSMRIKRGWPAERLLDPARRR